LTTFYGLYFSHQMHMFTNYNSFNDIDHLWAASMYCITPVFLTCGYLCS
jgi:hypothetical protein